MNKSTNATDYVQRLVAAIETCSSIDRSDREVSRIRHSGGRIWLVGRGFEFPKPLFADDPLVGQPLTLVSGGILRFRAQIREVKEKYSLRVEVEEYRMCVEELDTEGNPNRMECFRYDRPAKPPQGHGWDDDLDDNPQHPHGHLHINFASTGANDLRMPTGLVCPILLIKAFDYWYYETYVR